MSWQEKINEYRGLMLKISADHEGYNADEEIGYIATAFNNNWKLAQANDSAIEHLVRQIASVGLSLNPVHQFAFVQDQGVNLNAGDSTKSADWVQRPILKIEYKGLIELLTCTGAVNWIRADVVRQGDAFTYLGPYEKPDVRIANPFANDRVEVIGAYAVAQLPDGQHFCEIMRAEELEEVKRASQGVGPWKNEFKTEMYKKSAIKRLYKTIPQNPKDRERLDAAIEISNHADGFKFSSDTAKPKADVKPLIDAIEQNDGIAIIKIMDSLEDQEKIDIFGSFPDNKKTAYKAKARELMSDGFVILKETIERLNVAMEKDDASEASELLAETNWDDLKSRASSDLVNWIEGQQEDAA